MSTLSLVVLEGRQKIAMMRAMGLRDRNLYLALALECFRIATAGLVSGLALGAAASWALLRIPGFAQGLGKMGVADPRVMLRTGDLLAVALATWALFLVVAWWPAREACRIDPVSGLRS
jgi:ABC-type lipoprotein release transport system permease subunit